MTHFTWLHLTDLHYGMKEQHWLWPGVRELFFEDIDESLSGWNARCHRASGTEQQSTLDSPRLRVLDCLNNVLYAALQAHVRIQDRTIGLSVKPPSTITVE